MNTQVTSPKTSVLALSDGSIWPGIGYGKQGLVTGEVCFNTAMTGYQEILTDPSYTGQFVLFTFPHIGNCGTNSGDNESAHHGEDNPTSGAVAAIMRDTPTQSANWRAQSDITDWFVENNCVGISGIDTRALTAHIRVNGMQNAAILSSETAITDADIATALGAAKAAPPMDGLDLASVVSTRTPQTPAVVEGALPIAVVDFGIKHNILALLAQNDLTGTVFPTTATADEILAQNPAGIVFSNGPGDPEATLAQTGEMIRRLIASGLPVLGICLGHQLLALALGAKTVKMAQGHHGANHPIQNLGTGAVEIVSMNHGYVVDEASLPDGVGVSYRSLFDGTISGLKIQDKPIISVQHHPEASPGPQEGHAVFGDFASLVKAHANLKST